MRRTRTTGKSRSLNGGRQATSASLSVVVLGNGSAATTQRAASTVVSACRQMQVQVIVVAHGAVDASLATTLRGSGAQLVPAPETSTRAEMCDIGMHHATGAIVTVRDAADVGDASWVSVFGSVVPRVEAPRLPARETVVLDSMVAAGRRPADFPVGSPDADFTRVPAAALEMAAIM